ncbi:MAG: TIR domain-containing protein [Rhodospirillaceae bacterium]
MEYLKGEYKQEFSPKLFIAGEGARRPENGAAPGDEPMVPKDAGSAKEPAGQPPAARASGFRAFISYSHRDTKIAEWLHRAIETYRVPKPLIGRVTATGLIGPRPGKVFRDRDELEVAADLSGKINEALEQSQFLVVLCSPASARSNWVNQEVINFKRLKGAEHIIAVIVDGEPGHESQECFVPALRFKVSPAGELTNEPAEPIAADLRPGKDPKRRVQLKVVAGLLGVGLDELIRRDSQRRARVLLYASVAMGCVTLVLAGLTVEAVRARNLAIAAQTNADRKRAEAEELIEFLVGDLRTRLEPVGRLDVLDAVGQKVLSHFSSLRAEEQDDEALARRARALQMLGAIAMNKGDLADAGARFAEARETAEVLVRRNPSSAQRTYEYGEALVQVGGLLYRQGNYEESRRVFGQALETSQQLNKKANPATAWQIQLARVWLGLGNVSSDLLAAEQALGELREAQKIFERISQENPRDPAFMRDIGSVLEWIAGTYYRIGDFGQAIAYRKQQAAIYQRALSIDPANKIIKAELFSALRTLANINLNFGNDADARAQAEEALSVVTSLTDLDPGNTEWKAEQGRALLDLGDGYLEIPDLTRIDQYLSRAERLFHELTNIDPTVLKWQVDLIRADVMRARFFMAAGRDTEADRIFVQLRVRLDNLGRTFPDEPSLRDRTALANMYWGAALRRLGRSAESAQVLQAVLNSYPETPGRFELQAATTRAMSLFHLGRYTEAHRLLEQVHKTGYRRRSFRDAYAITSAHAK